MHQHPAKTCILLAIEDESLRSALEYILLTNDLRVLTASDAALLRGHLRVESPDVVLFEPRLPGLDAIALCSALRLERRTRDAVVLVLGSGPDDETGMALLRRGADEYISPPFAPAELLDRIRSLNKAHSKGPPQAATSLSFADLRLDATTYRVQRNGQAIHLGLTEFRLLQHLMKNPHRVHSRGDLQNALWRSGAQIGSRTVDVHIGRLRCALKRVGGPDLIRTVRSIGYSLTD